MHTVNNCLIRAKLREELRNIWEALNVGKALPRPKKRRVQMRRWSNDGEPCPIRQEK